jgi:hypothetical protein
MEKLKQFGSNTPLKRPGQPAEIAGFLSNESRTHRRKRVRPGEVYLIKPIRYSEMHMLKFLGGTVGIIFLIGLIVVIALFKFIF